jgi:hypothetical protein
MAKEERGIFFNSAREGKHGFQLFFSGCGFFPFFLFFGGWANAFGK